MAMTEKYALLEQQMEMVKRQNVLARAARDKESVFCESKLSVVETEWSNKNAVAWRSVALCRLSGQVVGEGRLRLARAVERWRANVYMARWDDAHDD